MKYNLFLYGTIEGDDIISTFKCGDVISSASGVSLKIGQIFMISENTARVTILVHGLKRSSIEDLISESQTDYFSFWELFRDYIGLEINDKIEIRGKVFNINIYEYSYEQ